MRKIRIQNDGQHAHMTRITDTEMGEEVAHVYRFELDVSKEPMATIYTYFPIIDWTGEVEVHKTCPCCKQEVKQ